MTTQIVFQVVIRMLGSRWGQNLVTSTIQRRFSRKWSSTELELLSKYLFHISAAPGNGEYALTKLLEPLMVALKPHGPSDYFIKCYIF